MMPHSLVFRATSHAALDDSLETPWRLFVLRALFCRLVQKKWAPKIFARQNVAPLFQTFFPYHGMMPHSIVFSTTSRVAFDDSLETPWRLFVLRALFCRLVQKKMGAENFRGPKRCAPFPNFFSLSRYDAALDRFFDYEPCGARRFFGDPMALIRFTDTFFTTRPAPPHPPEGIHIFYLST
jgi:hypothetical protein